MISNRFILLIFSYCVLLCETISLPITEKQLTIVENSGNDNDVFLSDSADVNTETKKFEVNKNDERQTVISYSEISEDEESDRDSNVEDETAQDEDIKIVTPATFLQTIQEMITNHAYEKKDTILNALGDMQNAIQTFKPFTTIIMAGKIFLINLNILSDDERTKCANNIILLTNYLENLISRILQWITSFVSGIQFRIRTVTPVTFRMAI